MPFAIALFSPIFRALYTTPLHILVLPFPYEQIWSSKIIPGFLAFALCCIYVFVVNALCSEAARYGVTYKYLHKYVG